MTEKVLKVVPTEKRPICSVDGCNRAAAINYKKDGRTQYRMNCTHCLREEKKPKKADWEIAGYIKKSKCEKCGFKAKYSDQIEVIKVKGTLHNYKSVCLNCEIELEKSGGWKQGDLTPDL